MASQKRISRKTKLISQVRAIRREQSTVDEPCFEKDNEVGLGTFINYVMRRGSSTNYVMLLGGCYLHYAKAYMIYGLPLRRGNRGGGYYLHYAKAFMIYGLPLRGGRGFLFL